MDNDTAGSDPFGLDRFTQAQDPVYDRVVAELQSGEKRTHWMWYIFPQIDGLGHSATAQFFAIKTLEEALQYLAHPVLGPRLLQCADLVLAVRGRGVSQIFGYPDDLKLCSSMTLFEQAAGPDSVFGRVIDRYFGGERDTRTLDLLAAHKGR
jgi:uncharacterized protein (DUF1810 family)